MADTQEPSGEGSKNDAKSSWVSLLFDIVSRHAKEVVGGALALAGTVEGDIRTFIMRFVRDLIVGFTLLFIGFGFVVFGIGMTAVEALRLGSAAGSLVVGTLFVVVGSFLLLLSRR